MKRILIAVGGTGGHLFPAQAFAEKLCKQDPELEVLFVGGGLQTSPFFDRSRFPYHEIPTASWGLKGVRKKWQSCRTIIRGLLESFRCIKRFAPDRVVGFGSFHTFPVLLATRLKGIPYILYEGNAIPGKVNRFFASRALVTAIQFPTTARHLRGPTIEVAPVNRPGYTPSFGAKEKARKYFHLDPSCFTFLVFGGSQGALNLNQLVLETMTQQLRSNYGAFQILHFVGEQEDLNNVEVIYSQYQMRAYVTRFEEKMEYAWLAADLAISRAGASSLGEQIELEIPSVLIPYPHATDNHQLYNAAYMAKEIGGAVMLEEKSLNPEVLARVIRTLIGEKRKRLIAMQENIRDYKKGRQWKDFVSVVGEMSGVRMR